MSSNNWKKIAIITTTESIWFETGLDIKKQLEAASIQVLKPAAFEPGSMADAALGEVKRSGFRIVFVLAYSADTQSAALLASREAMVAGWAWLIVEESIGGKELAGWLWFRPFLASGPMQAFAAQVSDYSKSHFNITVSADSVDLVYSAALHDAIMLYAHAATRVMSEGGSLRDGEAVTAAVRSTSFAGVGGTVVALDSNGDRIESYEVMNYIPGEGGVLSSVAVGMLDSMNGQYRAYPRAVLWPGKMMEVPVDYFSGERLFTGLSSSISFACNPACYVCR